MYEEQHSTFSGIVKRLRSEEGLVQGNVSGGVKMQREEQRPSSERGGVVVLDFGGQYTQLIARRIREQQVFSSVLPCTSPLEEVRKLEPVGIVLSGGPSSVYDPQAPKCDPAVLSLGVPVLGICYGMQWLTHHLGGKVEPAERREYGSAVLNIESAAHKSELFAEFPNSLRIWNSHGDHAGGLAPGFRTVGRTQNAVAAVEDPQRKIYAVEFHPEVRHTDRGTEILRNFLFRVCKAEKKWSGAAFIEETTEAIRTKVGNSRVICALSGGGGAPARAGLWHRAIGDQLTNVFVKTGLLRQNECRQSPRTLRDRLRLQVIGIDASDRFLAQLKGVTDPE